MFRKRGIPRLFRAGQLWFHFSFRYFVRLEFPLVAMQASVVLCLLALGAVAYGSPITPCPRITSFPYVDYDRYASHPWYEISVSELQRRTFEVNCHCSSTLYVPHDDENSIEVHNFCVRPGYYGHLSEINGTATPTDPNTPAKLQVDFSDNTNSTTNPQEAPYWIIMLDDDYEWAVVWGCQHGFKTMFVLNYQYEMDPDLYNSILAQAQDITGYDTSKMIMTPQGPPCTYSWLN